MDSESFMEIDVIGNIFWKNKDGKLHRLDGPAVECLNGYKAWYKNGLRHRLDGPARELESGARHWYQNGELHRLDGPAVEYNDGDKYWYKNGCYFKNKDIFFNHLTSKEKEIALFSEDFLNG